MAPCTPKKHICFSQESPKSPELYCHTRTSRTCFLAGFKQAPPELTSRLGGPDCGNNVVQSNIVQHTIV